MNDADRLLALLAVQNGFASAPQLLELAGARAPLGPLLRSRLGLGDVEIDMLQSLREAQLSRHGGDAARAARAVPAEEGFRRALEEKRESTDDTLAAPPSRGRGGEGTTRAAPAPERYLLGDEIGRGGLGRVLTAFDRSLDREVAVKLVLDAAAPDLADRFMREGKLTARLEHPAIVPVHDFGEIADAGGRRQLFLCMKRIRGRDLGNLLDGLRRGEKELAATWTRARLLGVFQDVCLGMAYAHSRGVIHRDLKPSNIMVGDFGETLIVDWGLAKVLGSGDDRAAWSRGQATVRVLAPRAAGAGDHPEAAMPAGVDAPGAASGVLVTMDGEIMGTPAYMPPEQAEGRLSEMDARSDIYSLGAILYELLTLRPAFRGNTGREVLDLVRAGTFDPPSRASGAPAELDPVVLKAMAPRREDRFADARQLHQEIQLFLEGVKELERARREAVERAAEGRRFLERFRTLRAKIAEAERDVAALSEKIKAHEPVEKKRPLWMAEGRLRVMRDERQESGSAAIFAFSQALAADAACADATAGICELLMERYLEAETAQNRDEMVQQRSLLARYDARREWAAKLDAPGRLSLRAFRWTCSCLRPRRYAEWPMFHELARVIPWRDGAPRPDLPLGSRDRPVPWIRTSAEGAAFGHRDGCPREDVAGVEVLGAKLEERDRKLVPGEMKVIGRTPIRGLALPRGSWLLRVRPGNGAADIDLPVRIDRDLEWTQDVNLYDPADVPDGFRLVTGGPFLFGGDNVAGTALETPVTRDLFFATEPVTWREYLEFLEDAHREAPDKLAGLVPAGTTPLVRREDGRWVKNFDSPEVSEWDTETPVRYIPWHAALAYAEWRSRRDGRHYSLPHEIEFEKAARGVDGRAYAFGNEFDGTYAHSVASFAEGTRVARCSKFPEDVSPYGIRGLSGGMATWCLNSLEVPYRPHIAVRGGAWNFQPRQARAMCRSAYLPDTGNWITGIRLVLRPYAWPRESGA